MTSPDRIVAHVDMDAFFAAIEVRDHPEYRGRPVLVGAPPRARGVVAAASYEARRFGIHSAMPSRQALARCPHAVFLPPDMEKYRVESARLFDLLETFTPRIEPISIDEAFLDLTGCPVPSGGDEPGIRFAVAIQRRIHERLRLPASVGVAPNKFLAKLASELAKPDGVRRIAADGVRAALDPLPVDALWGVGRETHARLRARGIETIGALRRTPVSTLRAMLGFAAERLSRLSRGEDDRPVDSGGEAKSVGRETTFEQDTRDPELLARTRRALCEDVAHRLRADGIAGRIVTMKVRFEPFDTVTRRTTLPAPTASGGRIARAVDDLWRRFEPLRRRVRLVGVTVSGLEHPAGAQVALFGTVGARGRSDVDKPASLDRLVDAINDRFGAGAVRPGRTVASSPPAGSRRGVREAGPSASSQAVEPRRPARRTRERRTDPRTEGPRSEESHP